MMYEESSCRLRLDDLVTSGALPESGLEDLFKLLAHGDHVMGLRVITANLGVFIGFLSVEVL